MIDADVIESTPRDTSSEKAPLGRILHNFRLRMRTPLPPLWVTFCHYGVTFHQVTNGQKAPLGPILSNFRMRMRTPNGNPKGSRDLRSLPVAMIFVLLYYICTITIVRKKCGEKAGHAQNILPVMMSLTVRASSGQVTFGDVTYGHVTSGSTTFANAVLYVSIYY